MAYLCECTRLLSKLVGISCRHPIEPKATTTTLNTKTERTIGLSDSMSKRCPHDDQGLNLIKFSHNLTNLFYPLLAQRRSTGPATLRTSRGDRKSRRSFNRICQVQQTCKATYFALGKSPPHKNTPSKSHDRSLKTLWFGLRRCSGSCQATTRAMRCTHSSLPRISMVSNIPKPTGCPVRATRRA